MKVVMVSSFPAFPTSAGNRSRIRQLAQAIRGLGHELTFVLLASPWEASDDAAHEKAFGAGRYFRIEKKHWRAKWLRDVFVGGAKRALRLAGVEAAYYSRLDRFRDRSLMQGLVRLGLRPDVVVVEYVLDSWAFEAFPGGARRVLDTHDAFADRHQGYVARGIQNFWVSLRPASENAGLRRAHVVLAIQEEEARRFQAQLAAECGTGNPDVAVVSHLLRAVDGAVDYGADASAVFIASENPANRHALDTLLSRILPRVVAELPEFDLKLVGSICNVVPDRPNVTKLGWIDDVAQAFAAAPLSLNPLLAGTGISIKLLDAMACGVPTISTATGVRGLPEDLRQGVCVVPDDDAQAFASATVRFARDAALRRAVGTAARQDAAQWNARQIAGLRRALAEPLAA